MDQPVASNSILRDLTALEKEEKMTEMLAHRLQECLNMASASTSESGFKNQKHSDDLAWEGNHYFAEKDYLEAVAAYSRAIEANPGISVLYSNRALAHLKLDRPLLALRDTDLGLELDPINAKLVYRKGKALVQLKRYDEAVKFLAEVGHQIDFSTNKPLMELAKDAKRMHAEFEHGKYDIMKMIDEAKRSRLLENHAEYFASAKMQLKQIDGRGRGLVATEKIEAGTLLIVSKAFIFIDGSDGSAAQAIDTVSFAPLAHLVWEKLTNHPKLVQDFFTLYAGETLGYLEDINPDDVNLNRIYGIVRHNTFISVDVFHDDQNAESPKDGGLWIMPSFINHSCIDGNCVRFNIGDFMFVRSKKLIKPGEELLFEYISPWKTYEKRVQALSNQFGFECSCRLCRADQKESQKTLRRINEISETIDVMYKRVERQGQFAPNDMVLLKALLKEALEYRPEKELNSVAVRILKCLAGATLISNRAYSLQLLREIVEIRRNVGDLFTALVNAKLYLELLLKSFKNEKEMIKWHSVVKKLAKLTFGDERVMDIIQAK